MRLLPLYRIGYKKQPNITKNLQYIHINIFLDLGCISIIMNTYKHYSFFIMLIDFTEYELETIANAMQDYINYDDENLNTEFLFGGLSVADRVTSINNKIDSILYK